MHFIFFFICFQKWRIASSSGQSLIYFLGHMISKNTQQLVDDSNQLSHYLL